MNVSQATQEALMEIIAQCFYVNRKLDRLVSVLGVKLVCNRLSGLIHEGIAHYFPKLSDQLGELCLERYNIPVEYGATPDGKEDYAGVVEAMQALEDYVVEFHTMFIGVNKIAFENNDLHVFADLQDLMEDLNEVVEQCMLLNDKAKLYGNDRAMQMDKAAYDFWILEKED